MGIFYHPPQPTQAAPHVPIPPQGDQPPRKAVASSPALAWFDAAWPVQRRPLSAAWDVAVVQPDQIPLAVWRWAIWRAWEGADPLLSRRAAIAPLTLIYGDAPPIVSPTALRVLSQWHDAPSVSPPRSPVAAWNVPPAAVERVPPALLPLAIWLAWQGEHAPAVPRRAIAPLTLVYGDAPPPRLLSAPWQVLTQWLGPDWRERTAPPNAAWNIPPAVPGDAPPPRLMHWQVLAKYFDTTWSAQRHAPNAPWNIAPITPANRIVYVRLDDRTVLVVADDRVIDVLLDDRTILLH